MRDTRPARSVVRFEAIPEEMQRSPRWVGWSWEKAMKDGEEWNGRWTKVPRNVGTGAKASSTDAASWTTFALAQATYESGKFDGVGFVLGDGWAGVDLDGCRDPETGQLSWNIPTTTITPREIIDHLNSYTEISPTGTGIHIIVRGSLPPGVRQKTVSTLPKKKIELYDSGRYFTVTGNVLTGGGI